MKGTEEKQHVVAKSKDSRKDWVKRQSETKHFSPFYSFRSQFHMNRIIFTINIYGFSIQKESNYFLHRAWDGRNAFRLPPVY